MKIIDIVDLCLINLCIGKLIVQCNPGRRCIHQQPKMCSSPHLEKFPPTGYSPPTKFLSPPRRVNSLALNNNFHDITQQKLCSCTIFVLGSYSLYTQILLILILIDVQYLQNVRFSFESGSDSRNHYSSSHHSIKKSPSRVRLIFLKCHRENLSFRNLNVGRIMKTYSPTNFPSSYYDNKFLTVTEINFIV